MSDSEQPPKDPTPEPAAEPSPSGPGAEEMLALTEELGATPRRARRGTARRRGRLIGEHGEVEPDTGSATATVRSETAEAGAGTPAPTPPPPTPEVLDGEGRPIEDPAAVPAAGQDAGPGTSRVHHVVEPAVFLAMAVRSYLDGLDTHGHEHPVTVDRLARLRETLAAHDGDAPA